MPRCLKCAFFQSRVEYLGHVVSAEGLSPDPAKVQVVKDWKVPESVTKIRSFLGLAGYYRKVHPSIRQDCSTLDQLDPEKPPLYLALKRGGGFPAVEGCVHFMLQFCS